MDLLGKLAEWLDPQGWPQGDPAGRDPVNRDRQVRVTISFGRRKVDLAIGRSAKADEASHAPGAAEASRQAAQPGDCFWPNAREQAPAASFWDALDPTEREALRAVASWRTFAGGARLMEEGEPADHVMVILGGQVEIRRIDNGQERVLAIRGVGQLVGEAGALRVSVRSATVVALDLIWALVVQTKDFAAFLTAHPRVMAIVQNQVRQRRTERRAEFGHDNGPGRAGIGTDHGTAAADQPDPSLTAGFLWSRPRPLAGENCTVCLSDVVGFGARTRTDEDRRLIRATILKATRAALREIIDVRTEDRGDGFLYVIPPSVPTVQVMDRFLGELSTALTPGTPRFRWK